mmetsp:Transcript_15395/g.51871  ORF Transcript_15395/g.51871 Transcript_15395/m.51871 type:complete len:579 (+) Transcript_15395:66-1802(+)
MASTASASARGSAAFASPAWRSAALLSAERSASRPSRKSARAPASRATLATAKAARCASDGSPASMTSASLTAPSPRARASATPSSDDAMARQPTAARAQAASRPTSPASASQSFILSGFWRCARKASFGTMFVSASVAARWTMSLSENCKYSMVRMPPASLATRCRGTAPSESRFVRANRASKCIRSCAPCSLQSQSSGRIATRRCASVSWFGLVVTKILAAACAAWRRQATVNAAGAAPSSNAWPVAADGPTLASATQALKPPCCTKVPRTASSFASMLRTSANFCAVSTEGLADARCASATTPSATTNFRHLAAASSSVSSSASSSAFCLVTRWSSSYCSGVISISRSWKWRRRSSSFVTVRLANTVARPYATGAPGSAALARRQRSDKASPQRPEPCVNSSLTAESVDIAARTSTARSAQAASALASPPPVASRSSATAASRRRPVSVAPALRAFAARPSLATADAAADLTAAVAPSTMSFSSKFASTSGAKEARPASVDARQPSASAAKASAKASRVERSCITSKMLPPSKHSASASAANSAHPRWHAATMPAHRRRVARAPDHSPADSLLMP